MFLDPQGGLTVLEINTLPGMTATSLIPQSAMEAGITLPDLFGQLIEHAIERETLREAVETL
jgi:D-alanine-D-alanine ligase